MADDSGFGSPDFGSKFRDWVKRIARNEINRRRPAPEYGIVTSMNRAERYAMVAAPGDEPKKVPFGIVSPTGVGQRVRIGGAAGDRYIDGVVSPAWASYTPVWTSTGTAPVLNNGTISGRYFVIGDMCFVDISMKLGNTSTPGTGTYRLSLPLPASRRGILFAIFERTNTGVVRGGYGIADAGTSFVYAQRGTNDSAITEINPFTWGNNDLFDVRGWYPIA